MPEREEVPLDPHKRKLLNIIVYFPPHQLGIDAELEEPAVLEANQQFVVVLVVGVLVQFFDLAEREVDQSLAEFEHDLVVTEDEADLVVLAVDGLAAHEFTVHQDGHFSFHHLVLLYPQLLPTLLRLHSLVPHVHLLLARLLTRQGLLVASEAHHLS